MHASRDESQRPADAPDADALRRMRLAIADATFVAEGLTLGLLQRWAERSPPFDDLPLSMLVRPVGGRRGVEGRRHLRAVVTRGDSPPV